MRAGVTLIHISGKFDLMKVFLAFSFLLGGIEMMLLFHGWELVSHYRV